MATGFEGARVDPPLALAHSKAFASASGDGLIRSLSVSSRGYKLLTAVTSCSSTATAVAPIIPPGKHSQSSSWRPDPDGYGVSSFNNYGEHCLAYGGSYPSYGGSGMPSSSQHSSSWFGSYVGRPSRQYGGPSFHPQDIPPFIFPRDCAPIASGFVPHATASVASSLGDTVALLSSLFHVDVPSSLDSDLTMSFTQAQAFGGHFGLAPDPGYQHLPAVPTPTIPLGHSVDSWGASWCGARGPWGDPSNSFYSRYGTYSSWGGPSNSSGSSCSCSGSSSCGGSCCFSCSSSCSSQDPC
jgi:hypothetical protein